MTKAEIEEELKTLEAENEKLKLAKKSKADSNRELADELKLLEAENDKLKKELSTKRKNSSAGYQSTGKYVREEVADSVRDTSKTLSDESSKILRGITLSFFEPLRVYAEAVSVFADEISSGTQARSTKTTKETSARDRNVEDESGAYMDRSMSFTGDVFTGMAKSFNKIAEIPGRTIDKFYEGYKES